MTIISTTYPPLRYIMGLEKRFWRTPPVLYWNSVKLPWNKIQRWIKKPGSQLLKWRPGTIEWKAVALRKYIILIEKQNVLTFLGNSLCHGLHGNTKREGLPSSPYIDCLASLKSIGFFHLLKLDFGFHSSNFSILIQVRLLFLHWPPLSRKMVARCTC